MGRRRLRTAVVPFASAPARDPVRFPIDDASRSAYEAGDLYDAPGPTLLPEVTGITDGARWRAYLQKQSDRARAGHATKRDSSARADDAILDKIASYRRRVNRDAKSTEIARAIWPRIGKDGIRAEVERHGREAVVMLWRRHVDPEFDLPPDLGEEGVGNGR